MTTGPWGSDIGRKNMLKRCTKCAHIGRDRAKIAFGGGNLNADTVSVTIFGVHNGSRRRHARRSPKAVTEPLNAVTTAEGFQNGICDGLQCSESFCIGGSAFRMQLPNAAKINGAGLGYVLQGQLLVRQRPLECQRPSPNG